ncbi:hypothetical protein PISMIDRAFT_9526 [Pisolithus microcarpus 441]|uniref:Uncharacterized protein n=1 Tax=Pisolithus microcarpus 441 TaxID=765257 RepID=A0A0C9Z893_9AGAM|nr:hypothetical protein PISMIDRAFT_9526 [Pisolithus microcarpus 441]
MERGVESAIALDKRLETFHYGSQRTEWVTSMERATSVKQVVHVSVVMKRRPILGQPPGTPRGNSKQGDISKFTSGPFNSLPSIYNTDGQGNN